MRGRKSERPCFCEDAKAKKKKKKKKTTCGPGAAGRRHCRRFAPTRRKSCFCEDAKAKKKKTACGQGAAGKNARMSYSMRLSNTHLWMQLCGASSAGLGTPCFYLPERRVLSDLCTGRRVLFLDLRPPSKPGQDAATAGRHVVYRCRIVSMIGCPAHGPRR